MSQTYWIVSSEKVSYKSFDDQMYILNIKKSKIKLSSRRHFCLEMLKQNESSNKIHNASFAMKIRNYN